MGARFKIALYAPNASTADAASRAAFRRIARLDDIMSDYKPSSELMLLCQKSGRPPVKVSEDLFRVLEKSLEVSRSSDGAFDITVGPVVQLWRRARRRHELPDAQSLTQDLRLVGYGNLSLDPKARTAQLKTEGMLLDLGGIAKGYAADEALKVLKGYRITRALVAGGGDIAVGAPPPGRKGWLIGIASLDSSCGPPRRYVCLHDAGISTSGDAEQHVEIGGIRYSHIINPKTGQALTGRSSVTVIARDDTEADALATAVSVLGPERGLSLIRSTIGTSLLFVLETGDGLRSFECRFPPSALAPPSGVCPEASDSAGVPQPGRGACLPQFFK